MPAAAEHPDAPSRQRYRVAIIGGGPAGCACALALARHGVHDVLVIEAGDYTPLSAVDIFVKDLGLVLDVARASKFPLPLSSTAHQMFMQASTAGFAREDDSAVIKIFPGIELPAKK